MMPTTTLIGHPNQRPLKQIAKTMIGRLLGLTLASQCFAEFTDHLVGLLVICAVVGLYSQPLDSTMAWWYSIGRYAENPDTWPQGRFWAMGSDASVWAFWEVIRFRILEVSFGNHFVSCLVLFFAFASAFAFDSAFPSASCLCFCFCFCYLLLLFLLMLLPMLMLLAFAFAATFCFCFWFCLCFCFCLASPFAFAPAAFCFCCFCFCCYFCFCFLLIYFFVFFPLSFFLLVHLVRSSCCLVPSCEVLAAFLACVGHPALLSLVFLLKVLGFTVLCLLFWCSWQISSIRWVDPMPRHPYNACGLCALEGLRPMCPCLQGLRPLCPCMFCRDCGSRALSFVVLRPLYPCNLTMLCPCLLVLAVPVRLNTRHEKFYERPKNSWT